MVNWKIEQVACKDIPNAKHDLREARRGGDVGAIQAAEERLNKLTQRHEKLQTKYGELLRESYEAHTEDRGRSVGSGR